MIWSQTGLYIFGAIAFCWLFGLTVGLSFGSLRLAGWVLRYLSREPVADAKAGAISAVVAIAIYMAYLMMVSNWRDAGWAVNPWIVVPILSVTCALCSRSFSRLGAKRVLPPPLS